MATLLMVLKIIGIVLLCLLGLVLLLLLLILFVPVRYRIKGHYNEDTLIDARVSYLLHIFSVRFLYKEEFDMKIRIFGIPVRLKKKGKEEEKDKKDKTEKKKKSRRTIKEYIDILSDDSTKASWDVCSKRLGKMLKAILPRKLQLDIRYGLADPYYTSLVMSVYDIFYIYFNRIINIYPVYDEETVNVNGKCKGRIVLGILIWHLFAVMMDKNCRRFYGLITAKPEDNDIETVNGGSDE